MSESYKNFGGYVSILGGILYFCYGLLFALDPVANGDYDGPVEMFQTYVANEGMHLAFHLVFALLGVALLLVVPLMATLLSSERNRGWITTGTILGAIGAFTGVIMQARFWYHEQIWAPAFLEGDEAVRGIIMQIMPLLNPDPLWLFQFGALGVWMIIVSAIALQMQALNKIVAYAGIGCGIFNILMMLGHIAGLDIAVVIGGVLTSAITGPIWLIGTGVGLLRGQVQYVAKLARS